MNSDIAKVVDELMDSAADKVRPGCCGCAMVLDREYSQTPIPECLAGPGHIPRDDATGRMLYVSIGEIVTAEML